MIDLALDEECPFCECDGSAHDEMGCEFHLDCENTCFEDLLWIMATDEEGDLFDDEDDLF